MTKVIESLRQEAPARIDLINPELPTEIVELIHDLLQKRPEDRPPTALAVMNRMKAIRAGLNRLATQVAIEGDTLGPHSDRSAKDDDAKPTSLSFVDEKTLGQLDDGAGTSARPAASDQLTVEAGDSSKLGTAADRKPAKPHNKQASAPSAAPRSVAHPRPPQPTQDAAHQSTHFRTVEDQERLRGLLDQPPVDGQPSRVWQILSILAMLAVLCSGAVAFIYALRKPGPDQLYELVMQAQESGDTDTFRARADQFLRLYDKDPRRNELIVAMEEMDVYQVIRKLRAQALRIGGVDQLPPEEQAFLLAMEDRRHAPQSSLNRLRQWIAVYAPSGQSIANPSHTVSRQIMIRAAINEIERLQESSPTPGDQRVAELIARMDWGAENLPAKEQREMLQAIIDLFEEKLWAKEAVVESKARLETL
ncbi:MAG TPA: hypothetical protein DDZ51_26115 [Planctomycetaceae bacterium]|nr:hypothetical protein [Planctomycetaceae bacterium]